MNHLRFPRTYDEAFRTPEYANPIECFKPSIFASGWFWLGGAVSVALWTVVAIVSLAMTR